MKTTLSLFFLLTTTLKAQEYQPLNKDNLVYDVEVIVFARQLSQPLTESINSRMVNLDLPIKPLLKTQENIPLIQHSDSQELDLSGQQNVDQWQVPLEEGNSNLEALVWYLIDNNLQHPIINKLNSNPLIMPLHHQKWRQPATEFLSPTYVRVSSLLNGEEFTYITNDEFADDININLTDNYQENPLTDNHTDYEIDLPISFEPIIIPDYSFDGVVSFSEQRFTHFEVKMNFYRVDPNGEQLIYSIDQKTRIELEHWQYFDHQQFGVLAKVTQVKIEENNETDE